MKTFVVSETESGMRLLRLVELLSVGMPKSLLYKSFRNGRIKVNGKKQKENYRVQCGETLNLYINDEFFAEQEKKLNPCENFEVLFIDDNIGIVEKPSGVLCHSDNSGDGNLLDGFIEQFGSGTFRPCLVNRLDRGTEGLVIIARTHDAAEFAAKAMREKHITKLYLAVSTGMVSGVVKSGFERSDKITTATKGSEMVSEFKTVASKGSYHLLEVTLHTGKTHQIRAQLASLDCHIVGDRKYKGDLSLDKSVKNQLLCAYRLCFDNDLAPSLSGVSGRTFTAKRCTPKEYFDKI